MTDTATAPATETVSTPTTRKGKPAAVVTETPVEAVGAPQTAAAPLDANPVVPNASPVAYTKADLDAAVAAALAAKVAGTAPGYEDKSLRKGVSEQNGFTVTDR